MSADEFRSMLVEQRDARARHEQTTTDGLATTRELSASMVEIYRPLASLMGLSDAILKMVAADARQLAAAEAAFQAAVEAREAIEAVIADFDRGLKRDEPDDKDRTD
jgi:hypothetical protein